MVINRLSIRKFLSLVHTTRYLSPFVNFGLTSVQSMEFCRTLDGYGARIARR